MTSQLPDLGLSANGMWTRISLIELNRIIVEELNILEIIDSKVTVSVTGSRSGMTVEKLWMVFFWVIRTHITLNFITFINSIRKPYSGVWYDTMLIVSIKQKWCYSVLIIFNEHLLFINICKGSIAYDVDRKSLRGSLTYNSQLPPTRPLF